MNFNEYQEIAYSFAWYPDKGNNVVYPVLGLGGETGEVLEKFKKLWRDGPRDITDPDILSQELADQNILDKEWGSSPNKIKELILNLKEHGFELRKKDSLKITDEFREAIKKELGDVTWYIATIAKECGLSFQDVVDSNIEKLHGRKSKGSLAGSGDNR